ncbi:MAG: 5'-nucleotidase C-terminal domain-containing protein, partial [bacterium]
KAPNGNRDGETNNGDLVADAMLWSILHMDGAVTVDEDHVVAVTNGGGIRAAINPGDVTMKDVNTVLPFGNTVAVVYVKGSELLEALEASTYTTPIGGYPQTSGIQFTLDLTKEYDPNPETYPDSTYYGPASIQRVTITSINGKAFDPEATYAVVTNNFCSAGGDTYYVFKNASDQFDTGIPMDEAVMQYITEELGGVISAEKYAEPRGDQTYITEAAEEPATEPAPAEEPAPETPAAEYYTVVSGDCLWSIARRYYGTGTKWDTIYSFNHDVISDPNLIYIGQSLRVK